MPQHRTFWNARIERNATKTRALRRRRINGMKPKQIATLYVFGSESKPGRTYQTLVYIDGTTSCECPAWTYKRKTANGERTCKHVRFIECGLAAQHAVSMVEYSTPSPRARQAAVTLPVQRVPGDRENTFNFSPKRQFDFTE